METSLAIALITVLAAPLTTLAAWMAGRQKTKTEAAEIIAGASSDAVEAIKAVMESLKEQLNETRAELTELKKQNKALEVSLSKLSEQNKNLIEQNEFLAKEIAELKGHLGYFVDNDYR